MQKFGRAIAFLLSLAALTFLFAPWIPGLSGAKRRTITLYGFSILGDVINRGVFPAFAQHWEAKTGEKVELVSAFAGSGTVTNQIRLGVPAQVAILSLELDAMALEKDGIISEESWKRLPHGGILNQTPFVILVRPGNPQQITDFASLSRPGVGVVHPDPLTSGGAQWALLAEYGSVIRSGGSQQEALATLGAIWTNVVAQASSARSARTQFQGGFGDALITYEQELVADDRLEGQIVYPPCTVLSDHVVVVIERNIADSDRELLDGFVDFLWSKTAQEIFVAHGFRSLDPELNKSNPKLRPIARPFTVQDLGGWPKARQEIVEDVWRSQVMTKVGKP